MKKIILVLIVIVLLFTTGFAPVTNATKQQINVKSLIVNVDSITLTVGTTQKLTATILPINATNTKLTWRSYNPRVATVSANGEITALMTGQAYITATSSNRNADDCMVTVVNNVVSPAVEPTVTGTPGTELTTPPATEPTTVPPATEPTTVPVVPASLEPASLPNLYADGFESGLASFWRMEVSKTAYSTATSGNFKKSGNYALRMELRKSDYLDYGMCRSELKLAPETPREEHWYSFDVYLPNSADEDFVQDNSEEILAQWHNVPDKGEPYTCPPVSLMISGNQWVIDRCWDDAAMTSNQQMLQKGYTKSYLLGSYLQDKGTWVKWTFHIKWGWLASQNPIFEVYKNGVKVLDCSGLPNTTNDVYGNYFKMGIYKWDYAYNPSASIVDRRVVYFDNVMIK